MELVILIWGLCLVGLVGWGWWDSHKDYRKKSSKDIDVSIVLDTNKDRMRELMEAAVYKWLDANWERFGSEDEAQEWKQNFQRRWEEIE